MTRSFCWYQNICSCDIDHLWNWIMEGGFSVSQTHLVDIRFGMVLFSPDVKFIYGMCS